jgi:hypothetical protein
MFPMMSRYRKLGLEIISLEEDHSHRTKHLPIVEENIDDKVEYPFKLFLEEALNATKEHDEGQFHPNPWTTTNDNQGIFNKQPFWRCDTLQGTS